MRLLRVLLCDIRYQMKYGFYLLYLFLSFVYCLILLFLPPGIRRQAATLVILTDPALLGFLFIGGILLLEKGEGLHSYFSIIPVSVGEYIAAKCLSLSLISMLSGLLIAAFSLKGDVHYFLLTISLILGSGVFTLLGLPFGVIARSVNHYLVISIPMMVLLIIPPIAVLFGISHFLLELMPGTMLLRLLMVALGLKTFYPAIYAFIGLLVWTIPAFNYAHGRFSASLQVNGGVVE